MLKHITCISCPRGCKLEVEVESGKVIGVTGQKCPKGDEYARQELEHPLRIVTSVVLTKGLELKMAPVKTSRAIPKEKIMYAMEVIKAIRLERPVRVGEAVVKDFIMSGVDLITTRDVF